MKNKISILAVLALLLIPAGSLAAGIPGAAPADTAPSLTLTADETRRLTYIREEEKMARDVYLAMYDTYQLPLFRNIAASEQRHMNATRKLLDTYSVPDPAAGKGVGEFTDPGIRQLYLDLIAQGSISKVEAFRAGVLIEEKDIADLNEAIAAARHNDIIMVYNNLLLGSYSHLAAFESRLAG